MRCHLWFNSERLKNAGATYLEECWRKKKFWKISTWSKIEKQQTSNQRKVKRSYFNSHRVLCVIFSIIAQVITEKRAR